MDIEDYERDRAEKKLLMKLQEAEEAVKDGEGWLDLDELKALVGEWDPIFLNELAFGQIINMRYGKIM